MNSFLEQIKQFLKLLNRNKFRTILLVLGIILTSLTFSAGNIISSNVVLSTSVYYENFPKNAICVEGYFTDETLNMIPLYDKNLKTMAFYESDYHLYLYGEDNTNLPVTIYEVENDFYSYPLPSIDTTSSLEVTSLIAGRCFTDDDVKFNSRAIIIHNSVAQLLFKSSSVLGKKIKILNSVLSTTTNYEIVGILKDSPDILRAISSFSSENSKIKVPIYTPNCDRSAYNKVIGLAPEAIGETYKKGLIEFLNYYAKNTYRAFIVETQLEYIRKDKEGIEKIFNLLLAVMYAVSTIFIFSILLFFVKERVVEIGIRKAIGARSKDITFQFMFEMFFISLVSSIVGMVVGVFIGSLISFIITASIGKATVNITIQSTILPILISVTISLLASLIPSIIASRKTIKECLHFD